MNSVATLTELTPAQRLELLKMARARKLVGDRSELPPIEPAPREGRLPLSFGQERLWFIDRLEPGSAVYNLPAALRLTGALDEAALERALGEIVRRHEALRTTFAEADGSPVQVIAPFGGFSLPVEDLSELGEADREAAVGRRAGEEARRPFDLSAGPLFRAVLLRLGAEEHVLLLSMHHAVSDGWSMGVLFRELSVLYAAYREGRASPLPELAVQYADYAVWQREHLRGEVLERQLSYWRERLAGAPELLELPTDHPRPPARTYRSAVVPVELSLELLERLQRLGRSEEATLYMVLLGAFQLLLSKYGGSEDVVVGSPIAGRGRGEVEGLIGFFVNTLVLRTDLSGDPSFRALLGRVREVTLGAYEHQEVPFEKLVAELSPERSLSHSPLFQVSFTVDNAQNTGGGFAGLSVQGAGTEFEVAKFDLSLGLTETAQGLRGGLNYSTDLFERGTIERMLGHLARVLEQVAADADVRLSQLDLLGESERALVLEGWNPPAEYPADRCIHQLFEAQAARTPDAVAVTLDGHPKTYRELDEEANRLAHHLRKLGARPDMLVGLCVERSFETVTGILGIVKSGAGYLPLDPAYPEDRLAYMVEDSGVSIVVSTGNLADGLRLDATTIVRLDADADAIAAESSDTPEHGAGPDSLAYVIYTSGSTGKPKGVEVTHANVVRLFSATDAWFGFGPGDVWTLFHSYAFDFSVWELWGALLYGGRVVVVPFDVSRDPEAFHALVQREGVTVLNQTPSAFRQFIRVDAERGGDLALRVVVFGGEALEPASLREWVERRGAETPRLVNMYGITETTVHVTWRPLGREDVFGGSGSPIGRAIPDLRLYVLDPARRPVPIGVPGELYVGGAGVARGYLNRPELTAERFVDDPFAPGRLYRTGDRVRWMETASAEVRECGSALDPRENQRTSALPHSRTLSLEYLGRLDEQVKIRGFRIELGEIEVRLAEHPQVREAVVLAREDEPGDRRLVAYVVGEADEAALRAHLRQGLPEYMVPSAFVFLDALPLTANGKVDRKALPAPEPASAEETYVAPRTPVEEVLAGIWAEVLRLERVGVEESFFDLGGHSLLATRVMSRVRELFGVEVPLRALFEGPTVAELAGRVEEMQRAGEGVALPPLVPVAREAPLPLSFAQERLWFLHQMEPEGANYNMPWSIRLWGRLDASALEQALGALTERHEALRTTFRPVEQGAVQVVHPAAPARLPVLDLTGLAPENREEEARRLAREEAERPFDLERGPLLRARLVRLADEEHVLLLTMHHIVSDGWSMGVLFRELFTFYESLSRSSGAASPLPPLAVQYADFAVWQRGWLRGDVLQRQLDWWRDRLGGAPPALELPTDRPRPAAASSRGASHGFRIPAEITRGLRSLARREGATLYMVTHAALDLLLSRWSRQEDLVVGSPIAGRTQVGTEGLIGFFVNTLALRTDLSGDPTFGELLGRVRETALGAYAHQDLPFERLVEEVAPERGLSHTPLFQVMFQLQNANSGQGPAIAGLRPEPFGGEIRTSRFDLELDLREAGEELFGSLRFRTDLFDAATMERFAAQYQVVLAAAVAAPEERLSRLAIVPLEEARTLLAYGSGPAREDAGVPVHRLFAEQAARTPGAPAVLFAGESLAYAELDARAERLARRLRGLGVGTGTTVAVCLERGPGVLVAPLAVWKAGGVYLPLDPGHPVERLSFLLRDSGAKLVVSDLPLAGGLLEREADVLLLDPSAEGDLPGGELEPRGGGGPGDLAYLIYTSGSTGTPKAVMVEHAQLTHTLRASLETLGFAPGDVVAALASTSFDISLLELVTPLLAGGAVRIVPHEVARDPETLVEAAGDVSVLHAVPALMRQVVEVVRNGGTLPRTRLLLVGGDSVPPDLLEDMREVFPDARTVVLYGPTEAVIICATYAVPAEGAVAGHPLGRPLPGVRLAVRGPRGELAPVGVPGELWISGGGVARGYLCRSELNAEKFVGAGAERAYRTGDRARWRPDGVLEFLGRADEQVKVRGFRIEPGEVEAVLRGQPGVREAVVLAREDAPGDRRLVAYVVPGADGVETAGGGKEQVSEWETLFDDTYAEDEGEEDPTLALKGWNSSYTGEPIPREEMRAWVEHTAERILALGPERVLEVGCGTGLLLFRVAPHTRAYHGTDFSGVALEHIRRHAAGLPQVTLSEREGDQLDDYAGAGFDTVVVNSVAQYFPDLDYLLRVLEGAAAALRPGGRIFVGDVRSLPLLGAFHASVELARAPADLAINRLQARVRRGMAEEQELLLDPALFEALRARIPRLGRAEVQVKRGEYDNEVSRFRYDVVLHLDADLAAASAPVVREWSGEDADGLRALAEGSASALLVRGVPDARVREHVRAYELVSAGGEATDAAAVRALAAEDAGGIAPEALFALADELARGIEVRPGASGTLDVLFHPAGGVSSFPADQDEVQPWEAYANDPQWGRRMRALVPALREAARARLPEYMVPSAFVVLEAFPVTANGKVDRAALPAPDTTGSRGTYVAPRTPAEERMAGIWAQVLGVERVGAEDHFFDLGGHSLLATQLVSRVREAFRTELPLRAVFEAPTLAELTGRVEVLRAETPGDAGVPPLLSVPRDGSPLPLSFAQERLWFIDQLEPGSATYNLPAALRLAGALDEAALERSLSEIVRRHEALRTTFAEVDGSPVQVIAPFGGFTLPVEDLSGLGEADREAAVEQRAGEEARRVFDLAAGPLFRAALLRLGEEDRVLLLSMHHIVSDGWSMGVLFRELWALYAAYREGGESPLPELAVQYADYAAWQREQLSGEALDRQLSWWRERLAGAPELLELPTDHPRPAVQTFRGAAVLVELSPELLERLQRLGRSEGATLYMTLLGAFQVLLGRYAGTEDVVVGSPIAGRTRGEVEALIGFFVNTLVLRTDLSGDPSFREVLRRVREATLGAYAHQEVPFEKLVAELQPERSLSHSPLFQVSFALQDADGQGGAMPGLEVSEAGAEHASAKFDLSLMARATAQGLRVGLSYSTDLFEHGTAVRMLGHLARVLEQVAADADVRLSRLELLGEAERALVLDAWNRTAAEVPADRCVHALFEAQAARTPGAVAVRFEEESLTYGELNARANRLAHHLAGLGVGPETRVALCLERGPEMVVSVLAVLKAGGAYVPLDPAYPTERLAFMLADAAVPVLVTQESLRAVLSAGDGVRVVSVDGDGVAAQSAENPERGVSPGQLAYVIYTSGSTGTPKGVLVQHGSLANLLAVTRGAFGVGEGDVMPAMASYAFDIWLFEALLPLISGAAVRLVARERVLDVPALLEEIADATLVHAVPALMRQLVQAERETPRLGRLRRAFVGGDRVAADLLAEMRETFSRAETHVLYGPTEGTILASTHPVPEDGIVEGHPIGRPLGNVRLYVCDGLGSPQPAGVPGELLIGGAGVARGYLGRSAMTAERFVPDPFSVEGGARLYRTGDRARWRADGTLEYLGRLDGQVKIRGFRIEPGEIEAVLRLHAGVADCVVVAREDVPGDRRLVAYVAGGAEADALREHLRRSLPEYMVPAAFVGLDALPLTPNGKLDRRALPAPEYAADADPHAAPRTPVEEVLAGIWAEVLRIERVGRRDNFFDLGGHSLLAVQVISRVRQLLAVEAELGQVFTHPVLQDFARALETAARAELPPIEPASRGGPLPLSFAQQRLWFLEQLGNLGATYHISTQLRLRGALDRAALARALDGIVARHEALRTTFTEVDGAPEQRIAPVEGGFQLAEHDLVGEPDAELQRVMAKEARAPFDLRRGPLVRGRLVRLADDDHVLLLTMHHIVSDGWSMGVLFDELSALYAAHREGRDARLAPLPVQYADYAAWQRRWVEGDVLREQAEYWTRTLAGAPRLLELPTDRPRPAETDHAGAGFLLELDAELTAGLKALSRRHGTTLYMTLLAGWAAVLGRLSGQDDVVIGTPTAGRGRREIEGLIGFFVNTLAVRVDLSDAPTVAELLERVKERALEAQRHQDIPFEQVVERVDPVRSLSHTPLFQVMFTWQNAPRGAGLSLPGLEVGGAGAESTEVRAKFDLSLTLGEADDRIVGSLIYATSLLDRETVERWAGYLRRVLREMAAGEHRPVERLALLSGTERARVLEEWNRTGAAFAGESCLHALFEAQVRRTPDATALVFEGEPLAYAELNARANRLAHHLRSLGVGPDARVGLCLERSLEMMVGLLAVLKAGGAYVPLDPAYPAERVAYMLADSDPAVVLSQRGLRDRIGSTGAPVLELDEAAPAWGDRPATDPERGTLTPEHLAYVIYTSGSTGRPKGVGVPHRAVVNALGWMRELSGLAADDAVLHKTPYSFDASLRELLPPLLVGGRLVLARPEGHRDPGYLLELMQREGITTLHAVPSLLQALVDEGGLAACRALRTVMCGGDALPAELVRRFSGQAPWARLYNVYGPTEAAVDVTAWPCAGEPDAAALTPIGSPMANVRIYLLDPAGEPVPVGVAGELHIGGVQVARGYLGRAALTAERFVPDPFSVQGGARLYRTGDRARWRADGAIEYLGRLDFQVKVRGFRIELGEIEGALRRHEGVGDCVVVAHAEGGEQRLVAYVVGDVETDALRAHLRGSLPEYMVPSAFVFLDALPLTPNGKLDRKALPAPELAAAEETHVAPRNPVEEVLAGIWGEVLRLERVGVEESFFDLGGHSLLATRVVSRVRELFGVELPLRALFEGPTVAELAGRVEEIRRAELPVLPPVVPVGRAEALPLSFAQERLWFIDRLEPGSTVYNMAWQRRLRGMPDLGALERSLSEIVRRHASLRTTFREVDGSPVQVIAPFGAFALPVEDLSGLGEAEREAAVGRRAGEEALQPFDLAAGPLFRAVLLRLGARDHVLLLAMHHIVSDGWSMGVLDKELSALYAAYREGRASPLPELPVQYADYAVWQREQLAGEALERQLSYWRERLAGAPELLELPTDRPRPPVQTFRGATVPFALSPALLERLQALGRSEGATLYMVLLGAFQVLLGKYAGSEDVVVGSPIAGRTRGEVEALIGFFINALVLRTDLSGDPSFRAVLRQVREATLGAYEHQEVPFEKLVAELQPERSLSHSPLFQVMFTLQNAEGRGDALSGLEVGGAGAEYAIAKFDLSLTLMATPQGLRGGLNYSTDLFERGTIERMLEHLARVLEQVAAGADVRLSRLALTGPEERARVVVEWNRTERPYPRGVCVHALFDAQVRERPGAVALAWGDVELTYRALDARANQLAHHLVRLGVGPESRVGVLLERGVELIVSILAVLKAGGCYVPLDPGYPPERLRLMLSDSDARVLLSRAELAGVVEAGGLHVVHLDQAVDALASESTEAPCSGATAENLAYIVYTSGSTGKPKGVMVAHRHVVQLVVETDYVRIRPGDRVAQASNASFDALTFEAWGAFLNGATLVGIPRDVLLSSPALRELLREERITTLYQTTALLNQLSREQPDVFAPLRDVLFGGQAVDADSVRRLLKAGGPERLLHMYGPTETTAWCSWEQVEQVAEDALTVSVGRATGNQRIYLLDAALGPVPVGVPGEAYVGGDGVVRGYLERPGLTAERFIPDPFAAGPGARMYRTGDRLRWKDDGRLEFVGRVDEQVKIRGFRIEPGEIEAVLSAHAEVREARVIVREDQPGEKRLVAYVVGGVEADALRGHLRLSLPEYMVPGAFVVLEALPLTPNGKLDRRALPVPEHAADTDRYVAPRTPVEEVLAEIWAEVLRLERVGVHDSFFDLGGHSLLIMRLLAKIQATFDLEISIRTVFSMPTLDAMAGEIERRIYEDVATLSEFEAEQLAESNPVAGA